MSAMAPSYDSMMAEVDANEMRELITGGQMDSQLDKIEWAIRDRKRKLVDEARAEFEVGDQVVFDGVSPKYLNGWGGTITKLEDKSGWMEVDMGHRVRRFGPVVKCRRTHVKPSSE